MNWLKILYFLVWQVFFLFFPLSNVLLCIAYNSSASVSKCHCIMDIVRISAEWSKDCLWHLILCDINNKNSHTWQSLIWDGKANSFSSFGTDGKRECNSGSLLSEIEVTGHIILIHMYVNIVCFLIFTYCQLLFIASFNWGMSLWDPRIVHFHSHGGYMSCTYKQWWICRNSNGKQSKLICFCFK